MTPVIRTADSTLPSTTTGAWRNRDFRRLWLASAVSWFGSEIGELAIPLLAIITLSAGAAEVGLLRTAQFLPFLLATLPLGVLVDRRARRPLMIGADLGRFVLIGTIPLVVWAGVAGMEFLYIAVFAAGVLTVLYQLADFAFVPTVVAGHQLVDANGKLAAAQSANEIAGKGIGGAIVGLLTAPVAVLVNATTFLVSALSLLRISTVEPGRVHKPENRSSRRDVAEGLRLALRNRYVRPLLGEATTFNFFNEVFILGLLLFAVRDLGLGPVHIGLVFTAGGVGSFLGAWFGARATGRFGYGRVLLLTLILGNTAPAAVLLIADSPAAALATMSGLFLVMGIGIGVANVHAVSLRQTAVGDHVRGRVNAAYRLISWGAIPVGAALGGALAAGFGARPAMVVGALGMPLATIWVALSPVRRLATIHDATGQA
ncbi:MAG: MFS transporter [Acidimicrobiales bacterium]